MKRIHYYILLALCLLSTMPGMAEGWGVPFFRNYGAKEYNAHSRNFDVACDDHGTVYVANFEGLLYYDGASWRKLHTPGISRVTRLAKGDKGRIWIGGYNIFGYIEANDKGILQLTTIASDKDKDKIAEVDFIKVTKQCVMLHTTDGKAYRVDGEKRLVQIKKDVDKLFSNAADSVASLSLPRNIQVEYSAAQGVRISHGSSNWIGINEDDGLTSNAVNYITYDKHHTLWGATERGVFAMDVTSPYSQLSEHQGLKGGVNCISQIGSTIYIGTIEGLYACNGAKVQRVNGIALACWQLTRLSQQELLAATADGLFVISSQGARRITDTNTLSVYHDKSNGTFVTGEVDGVYRIGNSGSRTKLSALEKVTHISIDGNIITAESIYGEQWSIPCNDPTKAKCTRKSVDMNVPKLKYTDSKGWVWQTDNIGTALSVKGAAINGLQTWISPLRQKTINAIYADSDGKIWVGGDFGVIIGDLNAMAASKLPEKKQPYIRQITILGDSVVWGGYSKDDLSPLTEVGEISLPSYSNRITVYFSTGSNSSLTPTQYRYRINGGEWSAWSQETQVRFNNIVYGKMVIEIQAMDMYGQLSEVSKAALYVHFPFFLRWWAVLFYIVLLGMAIMAFMKWRTRILEQEKEKLEAVVAERTAELSTTLDELRQIQDSLVRMERTATAGKLTQGLIDRILNPINYINNFSHLTTGLAKDLREDIEDEKDAMTEDNYDDCQDILDMMTQNLQKIEQHGVNTTRTLRAMEAMLNYHVGNITSQDIVPLCNQIIAVASEYHKDNIKRCGISLVAQTPQEPVVVGMDAEAMNKALISLITNSIYAVVKKYEQSPYSPEVILKVSTDDEGNATILLHDNGIGIEDTIKDKIFDPFFTTKPTGEAAGVGLYLVREIINDHKAAISVASEKNEYCDFIIKFSN